MAKNTPAAPQVPVATIEHNASPLEEFVDTHKKPLLLAVLALAVITVGTLFLMHSRRQAEAKANGALMGADTVEALREVIKEYPGNKVAGSARLLLADKLWEEDKKDESYEVLQAFVDGEKDHPLYYKGVSDLGLRDLEKGDFDKAIALQEQARQSEQLFDRKVALQRLGAAYTSKALAALAKGEKEAADKDFENARNAYGDLEAIADEYTKNVVTERKERLAILAVPADPAPDPVPAEEATAIPSPPPAGVPPVSVPPVDVSEPIEIPPLDAVPPGDGN